jgi:hypothetical protein
MRRTAIALIIQFPCILLVNRDRPRDEFPQTRPTAIESGGAETSPTIQIQSEKFPRFRGVLAVRIF